MIIRDFCKECKGKDCCDRMLKLQSLNDEYKHITNIILDINCELYRFGAINCTAYGTMRKEIRFEKGEFTQCKYCLYKSVCKHDPEFVIKEANDILNRMKDITDCKIACASFCPEQENSNNNDNKNYYCYTEDEVEGSFCELLGLKKISLPLFSNEKRADVYIPKDMPIDIVNIKDKKNRSSDLAVIKIPNKEKKGFFKGRKHTYSHIKYNK